MNDQEFDAMLRSALLEEQTRRWRPATETGPELVWSPQRAQRMARLYADPFGFGQRQTRPRWKRALSSAAQIAACLVLVGSITLAVSPAARAWAARVVQVVVEWVSDSTNFIFQGNASGEVGEWQLGCIPDGYVETEFFEFSNGASQKLETDDGTSLYFDYTLVSDGSMIDFDNEHADYEALTIHNQPAHLFRSNTAGKPSSLIFYDESGSVCFQIISHETPETILELAQSVQKKAQ